jgi:hypothetical protein
VQKQHHLQTQTSNQHIRSNTVIWQFTMGNRQLQLQQLLIALATAMYYMHDPKKDAACL